MDLLDSRSKAILNWLAQSDEYVSAHELGEKLNITARMVRYKIDELEPWVNSFDAKVLKKHGRGYRISCSPEKQRELVIATRATPKQSELMVPSERRYCILLNLFLSSEPLLVKQLERKLNVSRSTILRDFDLVTKWLNNKYLQLIRKPNFGFQITGEEQHFRQGLVDLLMNCVDSKDFSYLFSRKFYKYSQLQKTRTEFVKDLSIFIESLNCVDIAQIFRSFNAEHDIKISDYA